VALHLGVVRLVQPAPFHELVALVVRRLRRRRPVVAVTP